MTYQEVYLMENLTIEAKAIYGMMCSYAGTGDTVYPSVEFMCDKLQIGKTRFYKHMNLLIGAGVVEKVTVRNEKGFFSPNTYRLVPNSQYTQNPYTENRETDGRDTENRNPEYEETNNNTFTNNTINNNTIKKSSGKFIPPTVEEVESYCREKGYDVNPERFVDFYSAKNWMIGKNKMVNWQAAVRTWVRRDGTSKQQAAPKQKAEIPEYVKMYKNLPTSPDDPFQ